MSKLQTRIGAPRTTQLTTEIDVQRIYLSIFSCLAHVF